MGPCDPLAPRPIRCVGQPFLLRWLGDEVFPDLVTTSGHRTDIASRCRERHLRNLGKKGLRQPCSNVPRNCDSPQTHLTIVFAAFDFFKTVRNGTGQRGGQRNPKLALTDLPKSGNTPTRDIDVSQ